MFDIQQTVKAKFLIALNLGYSAKKNKKAVSADLPNICMSLKRAFQIN